MDTTISPWLIYLVLEADVLNKISAVLFFACSIPILVCGIAVIAYHVDGSSTHRDEGRRKKEFESRDYMGRWLKGFLAAGLFMGAVTVVVPSTKTLMAMFAIPTIIQVADDVGLDDTAKKSVEAVNKLLEAYIEDTPAAQ